MPPVGSLGSVLDIIHTVGVRQTAASLKPAGSVRLGSGDRAHSKLPNRRRYTRIGTYLERYTSLKMKRALSAALFSAVFCALSSTVFFTVQAATIAHEFHPRTLINASIMIGVFSVPIGGVLGFLAGGVGGWILPLFPFVSTRARFVGVGSALGGTLACILLCLHSIFPPEGNVKDPIDIPWYLFILIGTLCGGTWSWFWYRYGEKTVTPS